MKYIPRILVVLLLTINCTFGQSYTATYGSAYAGSSGIRNNPAASVNSAFKWEVTPFSVQTKASTNSFSLSKNELSFIPDSMNRFFHHNVDVSLLNVLYKLNPSSAFAFNLRARAYNHIRTAPVSGSNSISSIQDFMSMNNNHAYLDGVVTHNGWIQADLNYSRVINENYNSRLTAGATLQIHKNISGAFARIGKLSYLESKFPSDTVYTFTAGSAALAYSSNYDGSAPGAGSPVKEFLKNSLTSLGISFGIEYLLYNEFTNNYQQNNVLNYQWKIGIAIMDLGANRFKPSEYASQFRNLNPGITDNSLDNKLLNTLLGNDFRDSLATVFSNGEAITNNFKIGNPTRLVVNVDRSFGNGLYINGDLNINLHGSSNSRKLLTREINLLTITPRWETLSWGVYLPVQFNSQKQFHIGAAIKAGPLMIGLHNIQWIKDIRNLSGGGYLMLRIHPFNKKRLLNKLDCPE